MTDPKIENPAALNEYEKALVRYGIQVSGTALEICNGTTGHSVRPIAFCASPEYARLLAAAVNSILRNESV